MKTLLAFSLGIAIAFPIAPAAACGPVQPLLGKLAEAVISDDPAAAAAAVEGLRASGPEGLAALVELHDKTVHRYFGSQEEQSSAQEAGRRLSAAIDAVGGQRNCAASRLYWFTDLAAAKAEAARTGKPILSLRMLGNLTDEFSCANSRFFRTTLYANRDVSKFLRDKFVLHWKSVRPVPKVTIDFGDGRKIERTLTGNSIHYVLDSRGRVIDALPGLYGPQAFLRALVRLEVASVALAPVDDGTYDAWLRDYHNGCVRETVAAWSNDLKQLGMAVPSQATLTASGQQEQDNAATNNGAPPTAKAATGRARSKADVELPILAAMSPEAGSALDATTGDEVWEQIAALHGEDSRLDDASVSVIRAQNPTALAAGRRAITKRVVEDPVLRMVRLLQQSISLDTVRNEYTLHRRFHEWFAAGEAPTDLDSLNERVYAELFLTPSSDPWLGLNPGDAYTALENNGVIE